MLRRLRGLFLPVAGERRRLPSVVHRRRPHRRAFLRLDRPRRPNLGNLLPPRRADPHPLARPPDRCQPTHVPRPLPNHPPRVQERRDDLRLLDRPQAGVSFFARRRLFWLFWGAKKGGVFWAPPKKSPAAVRY